MMTQSRSKDEFIQQASMSQRLADKIPIYQKLAGSDTEISESIGILTVFGKHKILDLKEPGFKLIMDILEVRRQAAFATSERVNEITKMGMQMPRAEEDIDGDE